MQLQQLLTVRPPNVGILSAGNCADPCLRTTQMRGDLHLSATRSDDVSDDVLPVHAHYYQETTNQGQQQTDRYFYHNPDMVSEHNMETMSGRLKYARESLLGISQPELARRAGISQSFIGALESVNQQNSKYLPEIAHALGVSAYWLKTGKGKTPSKEDLYKIEPAQELNAKEPNLVSQEDQRILSLFKRLPKAERTALLAMLEARLNTIQAERRLPKIYGEVDTEDLETTRDKKLGRLAMSNKSAQ